MTNSAFPQDSKYGISGSRRMAVARLWSGFGEVSERRFWPILWTITGLGLICRVIYDVGFQWSRVPPVLSDASFYRLQGAFLAAGDGFTSRINLNEVAAGFPYRVISPAGVDLLRAHLGQGKILSFAPAVHPPLTSLILALGYRLGLISYGSQLLIMAGFGTASILAIGACGRVAVDGRVGVIAAGIAALYPVFWIESGQIMSEPIAILLVALALLLTFRLRQNPTWWNACLLGVVCGLDCLARTEQLVMILILLWAGLIWSSKVGWRKKLALGAVGTVVALAVISPWVYRNFTLYNHSEYISTGEGTALASANCAGTYSGALFGDWDFECAVVPSAYIVPPENAANEDYYLRAQAFAFIKAHLSRLPAVMAARFGRVTYLFRPTQQVQLDVSGYGSSGSVEWAGVGVFWLLIPACVGGAIWMRRRRLFPLPFAFVMVFMLAVCTVVGPNLRMRAIGDVGLIVLASVGICGAVEYLSTRHNRNHHQLLDG